MHIKTVLVYHTEARAFSVNFVWMDPYMQCLSFNGVCAFNVTRMEAKFLTKTQKGKTKFHSRKCCSFSIENFTVNHTTTLDKYTIKR